MPVPPLVRHSVLAVLQPFLAAILVTGPLWSAADAAPPHDPLLLTRLAAAKRVTVQRIAGPPADACRPESLAPSDTIACYPASSVSPAPTEKWAVQLLDLSSQWAWRRDWAGLGARFVPAVGAHFRGDSSSADWLLSFEPLSAMIRVGGATLTSVTIPIESHAQLLRLMRDAFPKDAFVTAQADLEDARTAAGRHVDRAEYEGCDCWIAGSFKSPYKEVGSPRDSTGCYAAPPMPVSTASPIYPEFAKEAQIQGMLILHALISPDGSVASVRVLRGITGLNDSAVNAVRGWTFKPATKAGQPVCAWIEVAVDFRLPG